MWIECLSVSGEVFDSSSADSSPAPSADGVSKENMVTPTPSRARTTEDLFAAIHRYHDTFSLFTPLSTPSYTVTPASLLLTFFISRYKMHSTAVVYFSLCTLSFHFLFVSLHLPPFCQHLIPSFSPPHKPQRITLNSKLFLPLYPSTYNFSFPLLFLHSTSQS